MEGVLSARALDALPDAVVVCDREGVVTGVNRRAAELLPRLAPGERADRPGSPLPPVAEALAGEVVHDDGRRTLAIVCAELGGEEGGVVYSVRDVSGRARVEQAKTDFVATASHELRSPLTSIKGFVELLARSQDLPEREREFVAVILQSTDRLVDLVNDLLDVARIEAGQMEVHPRLFEIAEVVRDVAAQTTPRLGDKEQRLEVRVPPVLPRVLADPVRVRQILTHLIANAHEHTGRGGGISVSVRAERASVVISVADNGRGMGRDLLDRAFDRFVRREDGEGGSGLGLSLVKSLVELQGGSIQAQSEPGEGSTFSVRLPAEPQAGPARAGRSAIRGKRVLVVDDEEAAARLIAEQLGEFGVETVLCHSGEEALARLRAEHFDAMTLDILMPGQSGVEVLRILRADPEIDRTPVVVVSVLSGSEAVFGEWKLTKPVDPEELADVLGSALLAGRSRVLVVGRSALREQLEPGLTRLGLDHDWATSAAAAAQACAQRRYEVALVDAGMRGPEAVVDALDLRGRRLARAVVLFSSGDDVPGAGELAGEPVPIGEAPAVVLETLGA